MIGLPAVASEKRAAILWTDEAEELDFTEDSLAIWDNLIDYMIGGKQGATIGFLPDRGLATPDFLSVRLEDAGHTTVDVPPDLPDPAGLDLVIQTSGAGPTNVTDFATFGGTGYPVPVITYNAGQHDDELVSSIGAATTGGPIQVTIVEANKDHPIIGGKSGTINWVDEFISDVPLQGIGASLPSGSTVLGVSNFCRRVHFQESKTREQRRVCTGSPPPLSRQYTDTRRFCPGQRQPAGHRGHRIVLPHLVPRRHQV